MVLEVVNVLIDESWVRVSPSVARMAAFTRVVCTDNKRWSSVKSALTLVHHFRHATISAGANGLEFNSFRTSLNVMVLIYPLDSRTVSIFRASEMTSWGTTAKFLTKEESDGSGMRISEQFKTPRDDMIGKAALDEK